ncbi:hypothetical protein LTR78_003387 [Recurvomyces mirabilis]|uniref:ER lumen protein retaining receptor n=1 Tax=Recurvomyces mirabilis TaxID=574656 RepID=A0AAE0WRE0_9PEZI|nr:hypothetical protein LTR78_003387 [Recurvomyces mirabilis]KAK5154577.1 hypothetical protein LTS14_006715 [Recurvomyces mirabilis]
MPFNLSIFRILGDVSHTASKCILIWAIHTNQSAEGVSLLTQLLYIAVFGTRYLDLFWVRPWWSWWNTILKIFYIGSSAYIVWLMMRMFARTREKEYGWKLATWSLAACATTAPLVCLLFRGWKNSSISEVLWTFSIELESVAVLPQLLLLRQTSVPTVLDSFYLVTLGSYRFFYIINWIVRGFTHDGIFDPISAIFGVIQTALYVDFAWVYWTRQRVKLRGGGVVDSDDLGKSFLVRRFIGRGRGNAEEDEDTVDNETAALAGQENGTIDPSARPGAQRSGSGRWGARGISVSADDTLAEHDRNTVASRNAGAMADPDAFEDDLDEDADAPPPPAKDGKGNAKDEEHGGDEEEEGIGSSAEEWQENAPR